MRLDLLLFAEESSLLQMCQEGGLSCWVTGQVVMTRRAKLLIPEIFAVYTTVAPAPPIIDPAVAEVLFRSACRRVIEDVWGREMRISLTQPQVMHPLAYETLPQFIQQGNGNAESLASTALLFVAHMEALTLSGSSKFYGRRTTRLGSSGYLYDHSRSLVSRIEDPMSTFREHPVRGCLIVADEPETLYSVLSPLFQTDGFSNEEGSRRTLVICPREALPLLTRCCSVDPRSVLACARDLRGFQLGVVTVAATEMVHRSPHLVPTQWHRIVLVDWPRSGTSLRLLLHQGFSYKVSLGLALSSDLENQRGFVTLELIADLLGLPSSDLGDLSSLGEQLGQRVLRLDESHVRIAMQRYTSIAAPGIAEVETQGSTSVFHSYRRHRMLLFGSMAQVQPLGFTRLPTNVTVSNYFVATGTPSEFALRSYDGPTQECPVCLQNPPSVITRCGHWFCSECLGVALRIDDRCPSCRDSIVRKRDVIATQVLTSVQSNPCIDFLKNYIQSRAGTKLVVCMSFGDIHERLARHLRISGLPHVTCWRGTTRQLLRASYQLSNEASVCMLVDPSTTSCRWARWEGVDEVLMVWPLYTGQLEACCQIRDVMAACPGAKLQVVTRHAGIRLPELPQCDNCPCRCPVVISS